MAANRHPHATPDIYGNDIPNATTIPSSTHGINQTPSNSNALAR
ncbi:hypothetical protein [Vibrio quintilis]|uniref:Uncharacterized protein n=1 Tax=Vibrio quintilis TaxID=1117707 RepID=A0A1M7YX16_9VIBR|nr:hypothetical protein [Vibrio quintilis]SHO57053.1 hypothetical protein VQ7734_02822 [Vibrio quintilis]